MKKKRILLIDPPFRNLYMDKYSSTNYPLGLGYLAATVKTRSTWDVMVYNADFAAEREPCEVKYLVGEGFWNYQKTLADPSAGPWEKIRTLIRESSPSVVGVSVKSALLRSAATIARIVREVDGTITLIAGGPHATLAPQSLLKETCFDICVIGEGEKTLVELLDAIEKEADLRKVNGLVYRSRNGIVATPPREQIANLDELPFPHSCAPEILRDYESHPPKAFGHIMASRGCFRKCFFCSSRYIWGNRVRFRSPKNVVAEITGLMKRGIYFVHFEDDTFGMNDSYLQELTGEMSRSCKGLRWSCELHVSLAHAENLSRMKESGCTVIQLGIESGNNKMLKEMRKGFSIEEALAACERVRKFRMGLETFFLIGLPQETEENLKDTFKAIETIDCDKVIYSIFTPYPGTESFKLCQKMRLIGPHHDYSLYNHQSPLNCFFARISQPRFRELASQIEEIVSRKNEPLRRRKMARLINTFSTCGS